MNRGDESRQKEKPVSGREINAVDGFEAALKLAQVEMKSNEVRCDSSYLSRQTSMT